MHIETCEPSNKLDIRQQCGTWHRPLECQNFVKHKHKPPPSPSVWSVLDLGSFVLHTPWYCAHKLLLLLRHQQRYIYLESALGMIHVLSCSQSGAKCATRHVCLSEYVWMCVCVYAHIRRIHIYSAFNVLHARRLRRVVGEFKMLRT